MTQPKDLDLIRTSPDFDAGWYLSAYPDVAQSRMEPAEHFLRFGQLLNRDPGPGMCLRFVRHLYNIPARQEPLSFLRQLQAKAGGTLTPDKGRILMAANEVAYAGEHDRAIALALSHLPTELGYTVDALRANAALWRGDEAGWLNCVNSYLAKTGTKPIALAEEPGGVFQRIQGKSDSSVSGPLISVIMTAWNSEKTIRHAAMSILQQSWKSIELIIVDDASEDGTWAQMQSLAAEDQRVKILRNAVNCGTFASKNVAAQVCTGDWIACQDADDWSHPNRFEMQMDAMRKLGQMPRCSCVSMLRVEESGRIDRFAPISPYSLDGVARDAPISTIFERAFFFDFLGGWDNVRFGADTEITERVQAIIGDEYQRLNCIGMFCLISGSGLTSQPDHSIDRISGPSEKPRQYAKSFRRWHAGIKNNGGIFPLLGPVVDRQFDAPESFCVPSHHVARNMASFMLDQDVLSEPVSAICVSKRPEFLNNIVNNLRSQSHRDIRVIYVAHGPGHDLEKINRAFSGVGGVRIIPVVDPQKNLGELLNLALDLVDTDLVAKIDDDDYYGPHYILRSVAALKYSGFSDVAVVGKGRAYCYVEGAENFCIRFKANVENVIRDHVFGSTLFWSRKASGDLRFQNLPRGVDVAFLRDIKSRGKQIFSADRFDHVAMRRADIGSHTWKVSDEEFLKPTVKIASCLALELAYSNALTKTDNFEKEIEDVN